MSTCRETPCIYAAYMNIVLHMEAVYLNLIHIDNFHDA